MPNHIASLYISVNRMLFENAITSVQVTAMRTRKRAKPGHGIPADTKRWEGQALHELWKKRHRRTQAVFAADCGFSPGYLPQFFKGLRPLTIDLAEKFAAELNVDISDFSTRLSQERDSNIAQSSWPFRRVSRAQFNLLSRGQKFEIESRIIRELIDGGHLDEKSLAPLRLVKPQL